MIEIIKRIVESNPCLSEINRVRVERKIARIQREAQAGIQAYGLTIVEQVPLVLSDVAIEACVGFGTLLGFVREGGFIAHDFDIDFAFVSEDDKCWHVIEKVMSDCGFTKKREFGINGSITEQCYGLGKLTFDLFRLTPQENGLARAFLYSGEPNKRGKQFACSVRYVDLAIPRRMELLQVGEIQVKIPEDAERWLVALYGESWAIPDSAYRHDDYWKSLSGVIGHGRFF